MLTFSRLECIASAKHSLARTLESIMYSLASIQGVTGQCLLLLFRGVVERVAMKGVVIVSVGLVQGVFVLIIRMKGEGVVLLGRIKGVVDGWGVVE